MLQGFMAVFPQYTPPNNDSMRVNLFAESYGGKYGPIFADVWEEQNAKRLNGSVPANSTVKIRLESLGIINGCIDDAIQGPSYPQMAVNNSYGFKLGTELQAKFANDSFWSPDGCWNLVNQCRSAQQGFDPANSGFNRSVNAKCANAYSQCYEDVILPFLGTRSAYDIAHPPTDPFPPSQYLEYTNTPKFQSAIGAPINYTSVSYEVFREFTETGDWARGGTVSSLAGLLKKGIRVGLIYGDRDYICNWYGGEAVSLQLAKQTSASYAAKFPAAGYEAILVNDTYIGGVVRQYGNLSFSRIYQAGHSVPAYQPETAFQVFARIIMGTAIPNGKQVNLATYNTTGASNATASAKLPDAPKPTCWIRDIGNTCDDGQVAAIKKGNGVVINGVWYSASSDWPLATQSPSATTATTTTTQTLTGWFTATVTPPSAAYGSPRSSRILLLAAVGSSLAGWVAL
jgi:carboxypeptidase C (cathepsin A)